MLPCTVLPSLSLCANPSHSYCPCGITAGDGGGRGYFSGNKHKVAAPESGHSIPVYDRGVQSARGHGGKAADCDAHGQLHL